MYTTSILRYSFSKRSNLCTQAVITCAGIIYVEGIKQKVYFFSLAIASMYTSTAVVNLTLPQSTCVYDINRDELGMRHASNFLKVLLQFSCSYSVKNLLSCRFLLAYTKFIFSCKRFW